MIKLTFIFRCKVYRPSGSGTVRFCSGHNNYAITNLEGKNFWLVRQASWGLGGVLPCQIDVYEEFLIVRMDTFPVFFKNVIKLQIFLPLILYSLYDASDYLDCHTETKPRLHAG